MNSTLTLKRLTGFWLQKSKEKGGDKNTQREKAGHTFTDTNLCQKCAAVVLNEKILGADLPISRTSETSESKAKVALDLRNGYFDLPYKAKDEFPNLPFLTASSAAGCLFCKALLEAIQARSKDWQASFGNSRSIFIKLRYHCDSELGTQSFGQGEWPTMFSSLEACISPNANAEPLILVFKIYGEPHSLVADYLRIHRRPAENETLGESNLKMIAHWMDECSKNHETCRNSTSETQAWLPTRLVQLDETEHGITAKLITTEHLNGIKTDYVALTYCWGPLSNVRLKTTRADLANRMNSINIEELPRLYREAVLATRKLGINYIWVDSLCIIQDDDNDWHSEASHMGDIYRNAHVTLAPVSAASADDGFLTREHRFTLTKLPFNSSRQPGIKGSFNLFYAGEHGHRDEFDGDVELSRWNSRGWTLPERLLSRRIIFFGKDLLHFECRQHRRSENYNGLIRRELPWYDLIHGMEEWKGLRTAWRRLVRDYTSRTFTFNRDRVAAISGPAHDMTDALESIGHPIKYVAGHWMQDLCEELLWASNKPDKEPEVKAQAMDECDAPTWSWCSNNGVISWLPLARGTESFKPECTIHEIHQQKDHKGHKNSAKDEVLELNGLLREMPTVGALENVGSSFGERITVECFRGDDGMASVSIDLDYGLPHDMKDYINTESVYLAVLGHSQGQPLYKPRVIGLALVPVDGDPLDKKSKMYRRVGIFQTYDAWIFTADHHSTYKVL